MSQELFRRLWDTGGPEQKTIISCARDRHAEAVAWQMNNLYADWCRRNNRPRLDPYAFKCTASASGAQYLADLAGVRQTAETVRLSRREHLSAHPIVAFFPQGDVDKQVQISSLHETMFPQKRTVRRKTARTELDIANLIKELRDLLGLKQAQFAQKVSVTLTPVNHWENGKRKPQPFRVRRLVEMKEERDAEQKQSSKRKSE